MWQRWASAWGVARMGVAVAGASCLLLLAGPSAHAQKQGGTLTVGLELDIPGFDPLKVSVYETVAPT